MFLIASIFLISTASKPDESPRALTLEDYLNGNFQYKTFSPYWVSGHEYVHQSSENNVILYNVDNDYSTMILTNRTMKKVNASNYALSADKQFIALESNYTKVIILMYCLIRCVYVYQNNIYLKQSPRDPAFKITSDGKDNEIFNGIPDWVYEEEMLATKYALWWSPNGKYIAYVQFNDTNIPIIEYSYYGEEQYPRKITIPYPKAGAKNPTVRVFIVDTTNPEGLGPKEVPVPAMIASSDHYVTWLTWVTDNRICVQWLRRVQNFSVLAVCDFKGSSNSWDCPENQQHIEESRTGWAGGFFVSTPHFTSDSNSYYKIFSDKSGYKHIHYINGSVENAIPITSGQWEAIYIFRVTDDAVFYSSNEFEGYPGRRNIYKINLRTKPPRKQCITCNLRKERCQYYTARFSDNAKYYALICYGPGIPISTLFETQYDRELRIMEDNSELQSELVNIKMPKEEINKLEVDGITLWYKMLLPPEFDRSKKYPLLIQVYGGPCSQDVRLTFSVSWITYLVSKEGIIAVVVDGRGTAFQGDKMLYAVYRRLGLYEVEDQISAVKKFIEMGFVDEKRIAIWGWSYGGYVTSLALGSGSGVFKCGIAVAPVSSWEYYGMETFNKHCLGKQDILFNDFLHENSTVMVRAKNFQNVEYLLIHGTADDNVHFQNSAQIAKALVDAQVDFQAMWYTDQNHAIPGLSRKHLYTHMTHFIKQCFSLLE
uniref:Fibroblast activation protein alpha n=1 Tax=Crocodylus porosus TaxID=8502 RepID=A0A7M4FLV7_CROPO